MAYVSTCHFLQKIVENWDKETAVAIHQWYLKWNHNHCWTYELLLLVLHDLPCINTHVQYCHFSQKLEQPGFKNRTTEKQGVETQGFHYVLEILNRNKKE